MRKYCISLLLSLLFFSSYSQSRCFVQGVVRDKLSGEPLIGANVLVGNTGTSTDVFGFFSLEVLAEDSSLITASYVGYKNFSRFMRLQTNQRVDISLMPGVDLEEIQVQAVKKIENQMEIGVAEIPVQQIKTLPMFGEPDVLKALQLMPGVQGGADGRNGFYVRGGSPDQNLFLLDGTPIYYVNHLGGFVSVFSPEILKHVKLYKGGFPARYGGRLSSIVDLRMKEGHKKEHHGSWGLGLVSGDLTIEGPIDEKTSYLVSVRRMWLDLLTRPAIKIGTRNFSMGYNFYDSYGKISHEADEHNRLYLSFYGGDDRLSYHYKLRKEDRKGYSKYLWGNLLGTARWNHIYNARLYSDITLYYTRYRYRLNQYSKLESEKARMIYDAGFQEAGAKADYYWHLRNKLIFRFGGGFSGNWYNPGSITHSGSAENTAGVNNRLNGINSFVYLESEFFLFNQLGFNVGSRITNLAIDNSNYISFEPRIMAMLQLGQMGSFKAGYSRMQQPMHLLSYSGNSFPTDIWLPSSSKVEPAISDQYSLAFVRSLSNGKYELSVDAYYKEMHHLLAVKSGVTLVNSKKWDDNVEKGGKGTSQGIELMLQKKQGRTTGWVAYTLAKTDRQFENINGGKAYPFKYDRRHAVSVVLSHKLSHKVDFSATWSYGSGYPTTLHTTTYQTIGPVDYFDHLRWDWEDSSTDLESDDSFDINGDAYLYPGKNWLRMRAYHRLDIGFNFRKQKGKKERIWTLGVYNVYNRQNAVFYYFDHKDQNRSNPLVLYQQSGFPFIPSVKYSVRF